MGNYDTGSIAYYLVVTETFYLSPRLIRGMDVVNVTEGADSFTCNAYLALGEKNSLIDAGATSLVHERIDELCDGVHDVYMTHKHGDHVSELDQVIENHDPDVYMYDLDTRATGELSDGEKVDIAGEEHLCLHTPGHSDDHVVFLNRDRIFSGDVVVYNDGAYSDGSFGRTDMAGQSRDQLIESIQKISDELPETVEAMYPGHGDVYRGEEDSITEVVERALSRAQERQPKYG